MNYTDEQMDEMAVASTDLAHEKLARIERLAGERIADERLFPHQRDRGQTFTDVMAYLIGLGAFSMDDLDVAIGMVRSADERVAQHRWVS